METKEIIKFFDGVADFWDEDTVIDENVIIKILDNADIVENVSVLDVACGTGVLFNDYLNRNIRSLTAIDISPKMIEIAKSKFTAVDNLEIICGDVEKYNFNQKFDRIVIHNAFPHFPNPKRLIKRLCGLLNAGGILTVAHSMSKQKIDELHKSSASNVSIELLNCDELASIFEKYLNVTYKISDDKMYQVCGVLSSKKN